MIQVRFEVTRRERVNNRRSSHYEVIERTYDNLQQAMQFVQDFIAANPNMPEGNNGYWTVQIRSLEAWEVEGPNAVNNFEEVQ